MKVMHGDHAQVSPRRFYNAMGEAFRELYETGDHTRQWPPTEEHFLGILNHYALVCYRQYLERTKLPIFSDIDEKTSVRRPPPSEAIWPDLSDLHLSFKEYMKAERALGRLYLAPTAKKQVNARNKVKELSSTGPIPLRTVLATARRLAPQVRVHHDALDALKMVRYRAERHCLWEFLKYEAMDHQGVTSHRALREDKADLNPAVLYLLESLPYLQHKYHPFNLTAAQIERGIRNPKKAAVADVARKYRCSSKAVRSLFRKTFPPLKKQSDLSQQ